MKIAVIFCLIISLKITPAAAQKQDTARLFFGINQFVLTAQHKHTLDSLSNTIADTTTVHIFGFADYLGKRDSNYTLSIARAETVKRYLFGLHSQNQRMIASGKGQVDAVTKDMSALGEPLNRRVDIVITRQVIKAPAVVKPKSRHKDRLLITEPQPDKINDSVYTRIKDLPKLKIGDSLNFKEFTFQPGRHFLRQVAIHYMVALKDCLKANPTLKIEIQGHICCQYDGKDGMDFDTGKSNLSLSRAKFIYDYLVDEGISAGRLRYKGLGSKEPKIYPELTADDQYQNRRVVIVLLDK